MIRCIANFTMRKSLKEAEFALLLDVVTRRAPQFLPALQDRKCIELDVDQLNELRSALGQEFTATGLQPDHEPNVRGIQLEGLIDRLEPW